MEKIPLMRMVVLLYQLLFLQWVHQLLEKLVWDKNTPRNNKQAKNPFKSPKPHLSSQKFLTTNQRNQFNPTTYLINRYHFSSFKELSQTITSESFKPSSSKSFSKPPITS
uniref:Uncharacterized protein n=1 Tax=Lactuca sativa TaxID=4236 RepID=A0A9R1WX26_LACSA|nr:hypothetical protein LSAT_V11C800453980 [Lactuca sativa]